MIVTILLGGLLWRVRLDDEVKLDGERVAGLCDHDRSTITISRRLPTEARIRTFWHEVWHAVLGADPRGLDAERDEETCANLLGLGCTTIDPATFARIWLYLTREIECDHALLTPGCHPIPVVRPSRLIV